MHNTRPARKRHPEFAACFTRHLSAWSARTKARPSEFARRVGLSRSFVSRLRKGESRLDPAEPVFAGVCGELQLEPADAAELMRLCGIDLTPIGVAA